MPQLARAEIEARIPHRAPMLLLDRVLDYQPDVFLVAERFFPLDDGVFRGHFPERPILPGMLTVEALAQAAAVLVAESRSAKAEDCLFLFRGVEQVKFKRMVVPGDTLTLRVTQEKMRASLYTFDGEATIDGESCAMARFSAKFVLDGS